MADLPRRLKRSGLTMPIVTERFINNAWHRGCDYINMDLEDSVPPNLKDVARNLVRESIPVVNKGGADAVCRINHDLMEADLNAVVWPGLMMVNYPKTEYAHEIRRMDEIITRLEAERGIRPGAIEIGANIETAVASPRLRIVSASSRIRDFGGASGYDMSRDLGVEMFVGFDQFVYGKGEVELTARALGVEPRATPFTPNITGSVSDPDRAFAEADAARKCGFRIAAACIPTSSNLRIAASCPPTTKWPMLIGFLSNTASCPIPATLGCRLRTPPANPASSTATKPPVQGNCCNGARCARSATTKERSHRPRPRREESG